MKPFLMLAVLALSACSNPGLTARLGIGAGVLSVEPILSGKIGGATVHIEP